MAHDVFITYASADKPIADAVCARLEAARLRCWIAPRDILPGQDWTAAILNAIETSSVLVLVFSAQANESGGTYALYFSTRSCHCCAAGPGFCLPLMGN